MPQLETGFIPVADRCLLQDLCPSGMLSCHLKPARDLLLNLQNLTVVIRMQINLAVFTGFGVHMHFEFEFLQV